MINEEDSARLKGEILVLENTDILLTENDEESAVTERSETALSVWKAMIATDDPGIHHATKQALKNFCFEDKHLMLVSAWSAEEVKKIIADRPDLAVILLDMAVTIDCAGLQVLKYIREELKNLQVRVILYAEKIEYLPEESAIVNYEIDDCILKVELTKQRLITSAIASLRYYRDILELAESRKTLEQQKAQSARFLHQLKENRLRLIQAKKMSDFGSSIVEYAGEIKKYLKFISDGIHCTKYYVEDLKKYIELYSKTFPSPEGEIAEKAEEIDLAFILEDLPNLLLSMKLESTRIDEICTTSDIFSQVVREAKVSADIDDGINNKFKI